MVARWHRHQHRHRTAAPPPHRRHAPDQIIQDLMLKSPTQIKSAVKLAEYMANHARTIRGIVTGILKDDGSGQPIVDDSQTTKPLFVELYSLFSKIKEDLRPQLDTTGFADMYAQTVVYGLFIARYNDTTPEDFNRFEAIGNLRQESSLLKLFFAHIATATNQHPTLDVVIGKLCELYRLADVRALLDQDEAKDTVIHFYEEFLQRYDPDLRKALGVFYTPYQVVRYMVRMVDRVLVQDLGIEGGLSNNDTFDIELDSTPYYEGKSKREKTKVTRAVPRVSILDPAVGTGTFHAEIIRYIHDTYFAGSREAFWRDYILDSHGLMGRLIGFEIMMTSYVVAHLKVRRTIDETLGDAAAVQLPASSIYLTNTLAPPRSTVEEADQLRLFAVQDFSGAVTEEARQADTWKSHRPIKVIIGNPPYLAASTNPFDIRAYKTETDGVTDFKERKHWLNDDYVKFFRFAEQTIDGNDQGVLAFVSNNGYLDNHTFRGMRASLLRSFDQIYIVNLHGSAMKKETAPDGSRDENIFDIMQGISLFIGVKKTRDQGWAKVSYCDLWGERTRKLEMLETADIEFRELEPNQQTAYFVPFASEMKSGYEQGVSLASLLPVNVTGIITGNDKAAIAFTAEDLNRRIEIVRNAIDDAPILDLWKKYARGQTAKTIQDDVLLASGVVAPFNYRPFDNRWTYYSGKSCGWVLWPRETQTMGALLSASESPIGGNVGLVFQRFVKVGQSWQHIFICDSVADNCYMSNLTAERSYITPLYLRPDGMETEWRANFNEAELRRLVGNLATRPEPLQVFDYIYGILYDPNYREKYGEFLKRDLPRVPVVADPEAAANPDAFYVSQERFWQYVDAGSRLRKLHLLQDKRPVALTIEPNNSDDLEIGAINYKNGLLHLNKKKVIRGIPEEAWNYCIGGYQALPKWFKSHKGDPLDIKNFNHIETVTGALVETIRIQEELAKISAALSGHM